MPCFSFVETHWVWDRRSTRETAGEEEEENGEGVSIRGRAQRSQRLGGSEVRRSLQDPLYETLDPPLLLERGLQQHLQRLVLRRRLRPAALRASLGAGGRGGVAGRRDGVRGLTGVVGGGCVLRLRLRLQLVRLPLLLMRRLLVLRLQLLLRRLLEPRRDGRPGRRETPAFTGRCLSCTAAGGWLHVLLLLRLRPTGGQRSRLGGQRLRLLPRHKDGVSRVGHRPLGRRRLRRRRACVAARRLQGGGRGCGRPGVRGAGCTAASARRLVEGSRGRDRRHLRRCGVVRRPWRQRVMRLLLRLLLRRDERVRDGTLGRHGRVMVRRRRARDVFDRRCGSRRRRRRRRTCVAQCQRHLRRQRRG
eukprot:Rhum_TRINITY_DN14861_c5_g2::Rhum_TRINITY_DN14861_c5_g2_i1::g.124259::m.124259